MFNRTVRSIVQQINKVNKSAKVVAIGIYCVNYTKFGQLILRKISEIGATKCQILRLKCIKFNFGYGCAPDSAGGTYSTPPDPLAGFKGPYF